MRAHAGECAATHTGCAFGPHGPKGATQCEWCGESPGSHEVDPLCVRKLASCEYPACACVDEVEAEQANLRG